MHTRQVLRLAAAEGAPFIACSTFLCEVEHYKYRNAEDCAKDTALGEQGAGSYRCADAPPPDPYEQARAILLQASAAGADFIRCAEPLDGVELPLYEYRTNGPDGPALSGELCRAALGASRPDANPTKRVRQALKRRSDSPNE